jgi:Fur family ferric uptake transcriptional regulator/Fur family peroxide stress response transcriptional regulator
MSADEARSTPQRRAVLGVIDAADDHPTAAEVLERVCDVLPGVGAATVYRTLGMLVESGHLMEVRLGPGDAVRYDRNVARHDHLVCDACGKLIDVEIRIDRHRTLESLQARHAFRVTGYDLRIHGVCGDCDTSSE